MRYNVVLRYGIPRAGHEYVFARVRRENAAIAERDRMVEGTVDNLREHANGGRVVVGSLADDPNAVVVACIKPDGSTIYKVVTYRSTAPVKDDLEDALLASLLAYGGASL